MSDYDIETAQRDLRRIMAELGMSLHARTESSHEVVIREVLPRIRELRADEPVRVDPGPHTHEWHSGRCLIVGCDAIDPADVRVGDVVEVTQRSDEMRLRIVVEGEVYKVEDNSRHPFHIRGHGSPAIVGSTEVRLVHRPPEPDPEQVEALYEAIYRTAEGQRQVSNNGDGRADEYRAIADGLARQGVTVGATDA